MFISKIYVNRPVEVVYKIISNSDEVKILYVDSVKQDFDEIKNIDFRLDIIDSSPFSQVTYNLIPLNNSKQIKMQLQFKLFPSGKNRQGTKIVTGFEYENPESLKKFPIWKMITRISLVTSILSAIGISIPKMVVDACDIIGSHDFLPNHVMIEYGFDVICRINGP